MSHTNSTTNYGLPQWIGSDKPTFLGDFNSAFNTIDGQMKQNSTDAGQAVSTANAANATAIEASDRSITAKNTADTAKDTADAANALATTASNTATVAKNTADAAARTAEANNIGNLAPAYDETLTYNVGDVVSYIDENNSGKLYRCIVAWETPGAFNINYWDDITATALFEQGYTLVSDVSLDPNKSYQDNFHDTIYPILQTLLPTENTSEAAINKVKDSDIILVQWFSENNRFLKFALNIYSGFTSADPNTYVFSRLGQNDPENPGAPQQTFQVFTFGSLLRDNTHEMVIFEHDQITDPGDSSLVTKTLTSTLRSYTFRKPAQTNHILIYQRRTG